MYFGAIQTLSRSIAVQELVRGVSLVTVSCDMICYGDVSSVTLSAILRVPRHHPRERPRERPCKIN